MSSSFPLPVPRVRRRPVPPAAVAALALLPAALAAQAGRGAAATPITARDSSRRRLDIVVVSAMREARSVREVPFATSTVGADRWADRSGYGLDQALREVPGVLALSRAGTQDVRIVIRGFGARGAGDRSNAGTSRGVRVLLDGIPETEPDGRTSFDLVDLATIERVEVLRSNGSAAWGNAAGGVVSLSSRPSFTGTLGEASMQAGAYGLQRAIARAGTTFGGGAQVWLSATNTRFDGWRDHSDALRTQLVGGAAAPLPRGGQLGLQLAASNNLFRLPGPLTPAQYDADPRQSNPTYLTRDERRLNRVLRVGATLDQPVADSQDVSVMLYVNPKALQRSERNSFRDFTRYHVGGTASWGARFATGAVRHRLRAGTDAAYQDGAILFYSLAPGGVRGTTLTTNKGEGAQNVGLFVQDELAVGPRLRVLLGARYDDLSYFYKDFITPAISASRRFSRLTPRAGVTLALSEATSAYASYGGGVEIPAGNEVDPPAAGLPSSATMLNPLLAPIVSATWEVGGRHLVAREAGPLRLLSLDAAAYQTMVEGEPVPYNGGRFYLTAGEVRRRGAELGVLAAFAGGLTARVAATVASNTYLRYVVDSTYLGKPGARAVFDGNRVANLPGNFGTASLTWQPPSAPWLSFEAGLQHVGAYVADDANRVAVPAFTIWRASASADRPLGPVAVRVLWAVENAANARYVASAFTNPDYVNGAPAVFEPGLPRAMLLSVGIRRR